MEVDIPKKRGRGRPKKVVAAPIPEMLEDEPLEEIPAAEIIPLACPAPSDPDEEERVTLAAIPDLEETSVTFAPPVLEPMSLPNASQAQPMTVFTPRPSPPDDAPSGPGIPSGSYKEERRQIIDKIKKYRQGFDAARALPFHEDMSTDALRAMLDDIRLSISSRNTSMVFRTGYLTAVKGVELVGTKVGMRCYGLADCLGKSQDVADCLRELEVECGLKYISPWKRLAFISVSTAVVLHGVNQRAEMLAGFKSEPVSPVLDAKYKDL